MDKKLELLLLLVFSTNLVITMSNSDDFCGLKSLYWMSKLLNWDGSDPCGTNSWEGIKCTNSRVTSIRLSSMGLKGQLTEDIGSLSELQILDLSSNKQLTGPLPDSIGNLKNLQNLILVGCNFFGRIPYTIGSLQELLILSLNSNNFSGWIPPSIGNLSKLEWLDLTDNKLQGSIPVSNENSPGLDMLLRCKHFHLGKNQLTGPIPEKLFSSNMSLLHLLLDKNKLHGSNIPSTLAHVPNLTLVVIEDAELKGNIPRDLLYHPLLETLQLKNNQLTGTLEIGNSSKLKLIDLRNNFIMEFNYNSTDEVKNVRIMLENNTICNENGASIESYCSSSVPVSETHSSYSTDPNQCSPSPCSSDGQISSPNCICAYPYNGTLIFTAFSSDLGNISYFKDLERSLASDLKKYEQLPVDSVSLSNPTEQPNEYLRISLSVFPKGRDHFYKTEISTIHSALNFNVSISFRPLYFIGDIYGNYAGIGVHRKSSRLMIGIIVGAAAVIILLLVLIGTFTFRHYRREQRAIRSGNPSGLLNTAYWNTNSTRGSIPHLKGARMFSFGELKKYTNNFSAENEIGSGGYGKVYRGTLPTGELIAIKRAKLETKQGGIQFKTEIELLSTVHHKNLVSLLGFCFEQSEQILIYEYVPNGNLKDTLSGKSGIRFDWMRRLRVALGTARGLAYLHELVNPPIIHRDIKSTNVLLDNHLNAKVGDFGLSKLMGDCEKEYVSTQVKGTMGYLDPEYYMTQRLTEKSDVYSFGVLMLELITARKPIERGIYIVKEVRETMDKSKDLYNLHKILDPAIGLGIKLDGFERFVELAMRCVGNERADRPTMSEVVKEIESIMQLAGLNPSEELTSASASYEESIKASPITHSSGEFESH